MLDLIMVGGALQYSFYVDPVYYGLFTITGSDSWPGGPDWPVGACIVMRLLCTTLLHILQWDLFLGVGDVGRKVSQTVLFASVRILRYSESG